MNTPMEGTGIEERNADFDRDMRQLHASALSQISPQTLARLRNARHSAQTAPSHGQAWRWITATAFSAVLAVALGVQFMPRPGASPVATPMVAAANNSEDGYADTLATLDESPDLYMWLASSEAEPLAME